MKKLLLGAGACALALAGVGAAVALNANGPVETKAAVSATYLVGDGDFSSSSWSEAGGVQFMPSEDDKYISGALNVYLAEGDVFKVKHDAGWYGYNYLASGESYVAHTSFDNAAGTKYRIWIEKSALDWFPSGGTIYAHMFNTEEDKYATWQDPKTAMTYSSDGFYYIDVEATKLYSNIIFSDDKNQTDTLTMPDCINTNCYWVSGNDGKKINVYDPGWTNRSDNIRVQSSGYYNVYFGTDYKIYIEKPLDLLVNYVTEKKAENYLDVDEGDRADTCQAKYDEANRMYGNLSPADQETFEINYSDLYTAMLNWNTSRGGSMRITRTESDKTDFVVIGVAIGASVITLIGAGFIAFRRKRAE